MKVSHDNAEINNSCEAAGICAVIDSLESALSGFHIIAQLSISKLRSVSKLVLCLQVRDLEADKVEALCPPSTSAVAAGIRDMLNESSRVNARKGGSGPLQCLLQIPAVRL